MDLAQIMEATWPPASTRDLGPFRLREGAGGGKRVSAASALAPWDAAALDAAEAAMESPLFVLRDGDEGLDQALAARGYQIVDPVVGYAAPLGVLTGPLPPLAAFPHWPPLQIACELWAEGGIGPARIQVMGRVAGAKAAILARQDDAPAGVCFVGISGQDAMVHALEVSPRMRRMGVGQNLLRAAANWAEENGATRLSLVVTQRNTAARTLYERAGMDLLGGYHYRAKSP